MKKSRKEKEQHFWDRFAGEYDDFVEKRVAKKYEKIIDNLIIDTKTTRHLLEIATGTGVLSFKLCEHIPEITATDLSPEMIKIARQKAAEQSVKNITFAVENAYDLSFPDNSFDTVVASNVLHLMFGPAVALREMKRVVKDEGKIIIPTFCHGQNLLSHIVSRIMSLSGFKARSRWSVKSFMSFVRQNGLKPFRVEVIPGFMPLVYLVAKP
jgi:ubiquinone/menaquinone biosynthesis C-methylase UbiE